MSDAVASGVRLLRGSRLLLGTNGVLWIVLGALWLVRSFGEFPAAPHPAPLLAALMFGNAAILIALAFRLCATNGGLLRMAFIWVGANLILSFTDEVGSADFIVGALNAMTLFLLASFHQARGRTSP
jgi:hypothetical protein